MATEQMCCTCKFYNGDDAMCDWRGVKPWAFTQTILVLPDDGRGCPCWEKSKPTYTETPDAN